MKSIIIFAILILSTSIINAQESNNVAVAKFAAEKTIVTDKTDNSKVAVAQLRKHITENLKYPAVMFEHGIEGTVIAEVSISPEGKILKSTIVESPSKAFDSAVLKALKKISAIDMKEMPYEGMTSVQVPVVFSINN